jgi:tetratricopeptide (TPR) repeat protein
MERGPPIVFGLSALLTTAGLLAWMTWVPPTGYMLQIDRTREASEPSELATVCHLIGDVYLQQRQLRRAERAYRAALHFEPGHCKSLYSLGWLRHMKGDDEEARSYFEKCREIPADRKQPSRTWDVDQSPSFEIRLPRP